MERRLFLLQRLSAILMAPLVVIHLAMILYAVRGGLTAGEIVARTQSSALLQAFYVVFVVAAAIHAPIGLRRILREWTALEPRWVDRGMLVFGFVLLALGLRAVKALAGA